MMDAEFIMAILATVAVEAFWLAGIAFVTRPQLTQIEKWMRDNPPQPAPLSDVLDTYERMKKVSTD